MTGSLYSRTCHPFPSLRWCLLPTVVIVVVVVVRGGDGFAAVVAVVAGSGNQAKGSVAKARSPEYRAGSDGSALQQQLSPLSRRLGKDGADLRVGVPRGLQLYLFGHFFCRFASFFVCVWRWPRDDAQRERDRR